MRNWCSNLDASDIMLWFLFVIIFVWTGYGYGAELPSKNWTVIYVSSEEVSNQEDGKGSNAIDGDPKTIWHTEWTVKRPGHPHEIQVDLGSTQQISGFTYLPRQDHPHGRIKDYEFYVSDSKTEWGQYKSKGTFEDTTDLRTVMLPSVATGRYVRLVALSELGGKVFASIAELSVISDDSLHSFEQGNVKVTFGPSPDKRATGHNIYAKNLSTQAEEKFDLGKETFKTFNEGYFAEGVIYEITATAYGQIAGKAAESIRSEPARLKMTGNRLDRPGPLTITITIAIN